MPEVATVYVSPHLDDAVFSAGATMAIEARAGRPVRVVTVFSTGKEDAARRREDSLALARLGAERIDLALPEAPARDAKVRGASRFFGALCDRDLALVEVVACQLAPIVRGARVVAPLGVGLHVDHRIVHLACASLGDIDLAFYEDIPYALCPHQLSRRLAQLGLVSGKPRGSELTRALAAGGWWADRPFLRGSVPLPLWPLAATMVAWTQLRAPPLDGQRPLALALESHDASSAMDQKIDAIAAYESQWPLFYPSLSRFRDALAAYSHRLGSPFAIERFWRRAAVPMSSP